jgi:hypothetical protein
VADCTMLGGSDVSQYKGPGRARRAPHQPRASGLPNLPGSLASHVDVSNLPVAPNEGCPGGAGAAESGESPGINLQPE